MLNEVKHLSEFGYCAELHLPQRASSLRSE
jgi:hypothetical protein